MKVLFVCRANTGRSQVAMEFYNQLRPGQGASAGTKVDNPGQKLIDRIGADVIITVMQTYGIDISGNVRLQLTQPMLLDYDRVVVMAEPEFTPDWLATDPKTITWHITDAKGQSAEKTAEIVKQIKESVEALAETS